MSHTHDITAYFRDLLRLRLLAPLLGILDTVHKALAHLAVTWPPSISTDTLSTDTLTRPNSFPPGSSFQPGYPGNQPQILLILEPIHRPSNKVVFPSVSMGKQPTASTVQRMYLHHLSMRVRAQGRSPELHVNTCGVIEIFQH
ncbi:hypothetical protein B0H13DRAFT_1891130 [Mycena leptocephala]|nr:hypothetical protein B0H13DRAFT_1891130 [Mycena leptocephala]